MQILVYMDQSDLDEWDKCLDVCLRPSKECDDAKDTFWHNMIEKYPILKNRKLSINVIDRYIFQWDSIKDLKNSRIGRDNV